VTTQARRRSMVLIVRAWLEADGRLTVRLIDTVAPKGDGIYVTSIEAADEIFHDRLIKLLEDRHTGGG
jgi:hypothetical protein